VARGLARALREQPGLDLTDVAYTLQVGRKPLKERRVVVCSNREQAILALEDAARQDVVTGRSRASAPSVVFMFPGQGAQYVGMARGLLASEPVFREVVEQCSELLRTELGFDLRELLFCDAADRQRAEQQLIQTACAQPALFTIEYALARLWLHWGVTPSALIGHSVGEFVAACLAGVMRVEDALLLVAARGRAMQDCPPGSMLAVSLGEDELRPWLGEVELAAVNAPALTVVSGPSEAVARLREKLDRQQIKCRLLHTSHAFHSASMQPAVERLHEALRSIRLSPPRVRLISGATGTWLSDAEAVDPSYWAVQLRRPVHFASGLRELLADTNSVFLELGPGQALCSFVRLQANEAAAFASLRHPQEGRDDAEFLLQALGRAWIAGAAIDWQAYRGHERRQRVELPGYPFELQRFWVDARAPQSSAPAEESSDALELGGAGGLREDGEEAVPVAAPGATTELALAVIWQRIFGFPRVEPNDNFFELGGHSLLALELAFQVREVFQIELTLATLYTAPTVAALARYIDELTASEAAAPVAELPGLNPSPESAGEPFPITDVQHAYWVGRNAVFELGNVGSHFYQEFDCEGLDAGGLQAALRRAIQHHPMLRARIRSDGLQEILERVPEYELSSLDLRAQSEDERASVIEQLREQMVTSALAADVWPLFDIRVLRLSDSITRVCFKIDFLIADAQSIEVLLRDWARLYNAPAHDLPATTVSYRDYMLAVASLPGSELYRRSELYWRERIAELPPPPELPVLTGVEAAPAGAEASGAATSGVAPSARATRLRRRELRLEAAAWAELKSRGTKLGLTPSGMVCAAYGEVLARWSAQRTFTVNLTLFNRLPLHPDVGSIVGDFTSTTLLEIDMRGGTFVERAQRLQARLWSDMDHQYYSGVRVLRDIQRARGTHARAVMPFVFTSLLAQTAQTSDTWLGEGGYSASQSPQILIDHQVTELRSDLVCVWDVMEEAFPPGLIDAMFESFRLLLERLATDRAIWHATDVGVLPDDQLRQRAASNATAGELHSESLHGLVAQRAAFDPDALAIIAPDRVLSYRELVLASWRIARRLRLAGARPNALVGVVVEKGWEAVVAVLGVLQSGAAYLPLDPALPPARLRALLEHAEVQQVLTQTRVERSIEWPSGIRRWCVDDEETWMGDAEPLASLQAPTDLAYVIYTSGSTGQPKGVEIEHRGAVNTILDVNRRFGVSAKDRVLALSELGFDLSVYDIFGTLAAGGAIVLPEAGSRRDPRRWLTLMREAGVTLWNSVPALLQMLVEYANGLLDSGGDASDAPALPALRLVLLSGDWIPLSLPDQVRALAPAANVVSLGGATEASIWSILFPIHAVESGWRSIPYGAPMTNQSFHVLDSELQACPVWVPGMLYIGGVGLARGYWRDVERSRASFITHPRTGERLYATGDRGRSLPDGNIEFLGRIDQQVKVQGYRIELGEIEAALLEHPAIQAGVVSSVGVRLGRKQLVAHVVFEPRELAAAPDVREFLRQRLPEYMIPSRIVPLERLPLTPNGKVARLALPQLEVENGAPEAALAPLRTRVEHRLAEIWGALLGNPLLGLDSNFFELGGDSLLATQLLTRLRGAFAIELPLRTIFESVTLSRLAARIEAATVSQLPPESRGAAELGPRARTPMARGGRLPLSFAQRRLWYVEQVQPGTRAHLLTGVMHLNGPLALDAFDQSLELMLERHEVLRTMFRLLDGEPHQVISSSVRVRSRRLDWRQAVPRSSAAELRSGVQSLEERLGPLLEAEAREPFDLGTAPLLRTTLVQWADDVHLLVLTVHHIVADGWSLQVFFRELMILYAGISRGVRAPAALLPSLPVQYADYALWQHDRLRGGVLESLLDYWRGQLCRLSAFELPTDRRRPTVLGSSGATHTFELGSELSRGLRALGQSEQATTFMTLLALYSALLYRNTGEGDVVLGSNTANRDRSEIEGCMGLFANTVVLRVPVRGSDTLRELLREARRVALDAQAHQELPFDLLVEALNPRRAADRSPLFQLMFVYQPGAIRPINPPGLAASALEVDSQSAKFDLTLYMRDDPETIVGTFEYNTELFERTTVQRLAGQLCVMAASAVARPDACVQDLALGDRAELRERARRFYG
jgi:amino acid adenylation domain-containing protein